jgi:hypothetical protein
VLTFFVIDNVESVERIEAKQEEEEEPLTIDTTRTEYSTGKFILLKSIRQLI